VSKKVVVVVVVVPLGFSDEEARNTEKPEVVHAKGEQRRRKAN